MCDEGWKPIYLQESFERAAELEHQMFGNNHTSYRLQIIPLIETPDLLVDAKTLLDDYLRLHREKFGDEPPYLRAFIARSDPALNGGIVTAVLAAKGALCEFADLRKRPASPFTPSSASAASPFVAGFLPSMWTLFWTNTRASERSPSNRRSAMTIPNSKWSEPSAI
jgi:phosphoenolpyruvate carboxylase